MPAQQNDDLSRLFAQSMNISNPTPPPDPEPIFSPPPVQPQAASQPPSDPVTFTSTHYTHSRHVVSPTPEPRVQLSDQEMYDLLVQNSIDPHALLSNQVSLFRHAGPEQRLRLLELWRISPPNQGGYDLYKQQQSWPETSMAREEEMARLRHDRALDTTRWLAARPGQQDSASDLDASESRTTTDLLPPPPAPVPARPASAPGHRTSTGAEPYMLSGYEMLARRDYEAQEYAPLRESKRYNQATDPAFLGNGAWSEGQENAGAKAAQGQPQDDEMMM
jgi:hypothetical protein